MDVTVKNYQLSNLVQLLHNLLNVMKKYRDLTTYVPISIEIRSEDKIRSIIFDWPYGLKQVTLIIWRKDEGWVRLAKPVHIAHNQSRP